MSTRRKIGVIAVISSGISAVLVACFRLIPLQEMNTSPDLSYVLGEMIIVAAIEVHLAIVAANLPSLKALWTRVSGGSSNASQPYYLPQQSYKLSTFRSHCKMRESRVSNGNFSGASRSLPNKDSQEELFKKAGRTQVLTNADLGIVVTQEITVKNERISK
ncbi:hypothetical protein OPT61_g8514 [Boeremia exigua]|uniref:Uncharacterized protein n=1 Tax=Boeremia exigua TaxID=749465 RepID=A0ACC2HXX9_9PLEO|nr:hypothetical protein OPT61_g8514 [Boeremia exigua]